jgi:hypothetical protein
MHLAASADRRDTLWGIIHLGEYLVDRFDRSRPPIRRALFGPSITRHNLFVFFVADFQDFAIVIHKCGSNSAGSNINCQEKISDHTICDLRSLG